MSIHNIPFRQEISKVLSRYPLICRIQNMPSEDSNQTGHMLEGMFSDLAAGTVF